MKEQPLFPVIKKDLTKEQLQRAAANVKKKRRTNKIPKDTPNLFSKIETRLKPPPEILYPQPEEGHEQPPPVQDEKFPEIPKELKQYFDEADNHLHEKPTLFDEEEKSKWPIFNTRYFRRSVPKPWPFQVNIANNCLVKNQCDHNKSTMILVPPGRGKTRIAQMVMDSFLDRGKILIITHSGPLARQHYDDCKKVFKRDRVRRQLFIGSDPDAKKREQLYKEDINIYVSTSHDIANDLKAGRLDIRQFSLVVIDESQYAVKNHPHRVVGAYALKNNVPRLALTGTPAADSDKVKMKIKLATIMANLGLDEIEARFGDEPDIAPFMSHSKNRFIYVDLPKEYDEMNDLLYKITSKALARLIEAGYYIDQRLESYIRDQLNAKRSRVSYPVYKQITTDPKMRKANYMKEKHDPVLVMLIDEYYNLPSKKRDYLNRSILTGIERSIHKKAPNKWQIGKANSAHSQLVSISNMIRYSQTQCKDATIKFVQRNILVEDDKKYKRHIREDPLFTEYLELLKKAPENPKVQILLDLLDPKEPTVVFASYRDTVDSLKIRASSLLLKTTKLVGKKEGFTLEDQLKALKDFNKSRQDFIICTAAGEEGLDFKAEHVIHYDQKSTAISNEQRSGRAGRPDYDKRLKKLTKKASKITRIIAKDSSDVGAYFKSVHARKNMIKEIKELSEKIKNGDTSIRDYINKHLYDEQVDIDSIFDTGPKQYTLF